MRRRSRKNSYYDRPHSDLIAAWSLRVLVQLGAWRKLDSSQGCFSDDETFLQTVGLEHLIDKKILMSEFLKILKQRQKKVLENEISIDPALYKNVVILRDYIALNDSEIKLLTFALYLKTNKGLEEICNQLGELTSEAIIDVLSVILELSQEEVRYALSTKSLLFRSGILRMDRSTLNQLVYKIDLIEGFEILFETHSDADGLMKNFFKPVGEATLSVEDYKHLEDELHLAINYLDHVTQNNSIGVNLLIYGPPGTGKTELAKTISHHIDAKLYEVVTDDNESEPLSEKKRLDAFRLAQQVLAEREKTLLLFDEVENLLQGGFNLYFLFGRSDSPPTKACINKMLENNKVPAIWIANNIDYVDKAFIRRFDYVLRLEHPPQTIRAKIISKHLTGLPVSCDWISAVAENLNISPAAIAKASKVVTAMKTSEPDRIESTLELILGNSLTAMGHNSALKKRKAETLKYNLDAVNPDTDLTALIQGLKRRPEARLCLYGPPGTGKTEFGHYLAQTLDKRLLVKRASDILNPYVGGTETNIAGMFSEAKKEDAVLLLDEADSFLRDRNHARHSWEITQVNELLTQMEAYDGIFICSTNLMNSLDDASIRRFDLKIKFNYLKPEQAWLLFKQMLENFDIPLTDISQCKKELSRYDNLTPGDFATVVRQTRLDSIQQSPRGILERLAKESSFKAESSNRFQVGFV